MTTHAVAGPDRGRPESKLDVVADIALLAGGLADLARGLVVVSKYMYFDTMPRRSLTDQEVRHGRQLGRALAQRRSALAVSAQDVAARADLSVDALRSLESGRVATPAFLTVARLADVLDVSLDEMHRVASADQTP